MSRSNLYVKIIFICQNRILYVKVDHIWTDQSVTIKVKCQGQPNNENKCTIYVYEHALKWNNYEWLWMIFASIS